MKSFESVVNGAGDETGRFWTSGGRRVGWRDAEYQKLTALAAKIESATPVKGLVSGAFVLDTVFDWLRTTLEGGPPAKLHDHIARRCEEEIREVEIWIPLFRTYSSSQFRIGDVVFRTLTKTLMDEYFNRAPAGVSQDKAFEIAQNRKRSRMQASLAACVTVIAEKTKAVELAHSAVLDATALLRLLSPANWTSKLRSYCVPLGMEKTETATELFTNGSKILSIQERAISSGPLDWSLDDTLRSVPGCLQQLHRLASDRRSAFSEELYQSLILYSQSSLASRISDKLVFTFAALESILLKDATEPIQKNLGERIAFLIGTSLDERKEILRHIEDIYGARSRFVHHGKSIPDLGLVDKFLLIAWTCFVKLLEQSERYQTRAELVTALDDRKMS